MVQVHGILMMSAFGVIIPLGVFTSRYGKAWKQWFNTHRAVQVCGHTLFLNVVWRVINYI